MIKGDWVRTPVVDDLSHMEIGLGQEIGKEPDNWLPAFIDGDHAQIRMPDLEPGVWVVWLRRGGVAERRGTVISE